MFRRCTLLIALAIAGAATGNDECVDGVCASSTDVMLQMHGKKMGSAVTDLSMVTDDDVVTREDCFWKPVDQCPCSESSFSGCNLAECSLSQAPGSLCENDRALPNGTLFQNLDNCPGRFDVLEFVCPPTTTTPTPTTPPTPTGTQFPDQFFTCTGMTKKNSDGTTGPNESLYDSIQAKILAVFDGVTDADGTGLVCTKDLCPMADFLGCTLRMAGHDFMDARFLPSSSGSFVFNGLGADGCIDMNDKDNNGLMPCMVDGEFASQSNLNTAYDQAGVCDQVSLADFFVIAGETAIFRAREIARQNPAVAGPSTIQPPAADTEYNLGRRGDGFKFGRRTSAVCPVVNVPDEKEPAVEGVNAHLPGGMHGCNEVLRVFVNGLKLNWREATALMGVHTLGRASSINSPFDGPWSELPQQMRWNNNYYYSILGKGWVPMFTNDAQDAAYWVRGDGGGSAKRNNESQHDGGREMMLDTDMCLFWGVTNSGSGGIKVQDHLNNAVAAGRSGDARIDSFDAAAMLDPAIHNPTIGGCCTWLGTDDGTWPTTIKDMVLLHADNNSKALHCNQDIPPHFDHGKMNRNCCSKGPGTDDPVITAQTSRNDCTSVLWLSQGVSGGFRIPMGPGNNASSESAVHLFAENEAVWLDDFEGVWRKVTQYNFAFDPQFSSR